MSRQATHSARKARAVGINHIALEVGDIDEALDFYGSFLEFDIQSRSENAAFIYFGDQFINFSRGRRQGPDDDRHFGIAVDDKELVRRTLAEMGVELLDGTIPRLPRPVGQPGRDHHLHQHPVHQGRPRPARHGARAPREDGSAPPRSCARRAWRPRTWLQLRPRPATPCCRTARSACRRERIRRVVGRR